MEFKTRLRQARKNKKLSQTRLAEFVGLSPAAIQGLESGRIKSTTYINKLAEVLEVSAKWLEEGINEGNGGEENELIVLQYEQHKGKTVTMARIAKYQIPILAWNDFDSLKMTHLTTSSIDQILDMVREKKRMLTVFLEDKELSARMAALDVKDLDAMTPITFHKWGLVNDDKIIIDFNKSPNSGDIVLVKIGSSITVRQFAIDGDKQILKPLNTQYPIITENFKILGTIVQIIRKRE